MLASASPRRRALLAAAGLFPAVLPAAVDESLPAGMPAEEGARELARRKALAARERHGDGRRRWFVGADTIVAVGEGAAEVLLGKPAGEDEARAMLERLSGTRHRVVTAVCVALAPGGEVLQDSETTWVRMRPIGAEEREAYVRSGEWRDKAGGYAIQESADRFVLGLEGGGFDNVVGLPVARTLALLRASGAPVGPVGPVGPAPG